MSLFTAVACVVRVKAPAVLALDHVLHLLDALLDSSTHVSCSLREVAASGRVSWFNHVYQRTVVPLPVDSALQEHKICMAMAAAVQNGHMDIVQRIHALHPQRLPVRLLPIAAAKGKLDIFQWLLAHRTDDLCIPDTSNPRDANECAGKLSCCLKDAYLRALRCEQLHIVKWLLHNGYTPPSFLSLSSTRAGDKAAAGGDIDMVQWLHANEAQNCFSKRAIDLAAKHGHWAMLQYLLANRSDGFTSEAVHRALAGGDRETYEALRVSGVLSPEEFRDLSQWGPDAATRGRLDLLQSHRYVMKDATSAMASACECGHLEVARWLHGRYDIQPNAERAAANGHLHVLLWIHHHVCSKQNVPWSVDVMDSAATNGHLLTLQWLHENRNEGCTTKAMDKAAWRGDLEMVQWLHVNRTEGCTMQAMDYAAEKGHLALVQWLHENRTEGCSYFAMDAAADGNHQQVVEWLHCNRSEGCSEEAITSAASSGHLEMVIWLDTHTEEGSSTVRSIDAYATPSVRNWLLSKNYECMAAIAMEDAADRGDLEVMEFLHEHRTDRFNGRSSIGSMFWPFVPRAMASREVPRQV